jgi:hypothetical protein
MNTQVPAESLKKLFRAADAFREMAPWEWMLDTQMFGVINPVTGEKGYCSVMGNLGDYLALGVYPGAEGFRSFLSLFGDGETEVDPNESIYAQRCLVTAFEYLEEITDEDLTMFRSLGLDYGGERAWPDVRSYRPAMAPWAPDEEEVQFLTLVLEQATLFAAEVMDNPDLAPVFDPAKGGDLTFRKLVDGTWTNIMLPPDPPVDFSPAVLEFDPVEIENTLGLLDKIPGLWLLETFFLPSPVMEEHDDRPYFPKAVVLMHTDDGRILGLDAVKPTEFTTATRNTLVEIFLHFKSLPEEMVVSNRENYILLKDFCRLLDIKLHLDEELEVVDELRDEIFGQMMGGEPE